MSDSSLTHHFEAIKKHIDAGRRLNVPLTDIIREIRQASGLNIKNSIRMLYLLEPSYPGLTRYDGFLSHPARNINVD